MVCQQPEVCTLSDTRQIIAKVACRVGLDPPYSRNILILLVG